MSIFQNKLIQCNILNQLFELPRCLTRSWITRCKLYLTDLYIIEEVVFTNIVKTTNYNENLSGYKYKLSNETSKRIVSRKISAGKSL